MGLKDDFKANMAGNKAYRTHAQANRMNDLGKASEAEALYKTAMELYKEAENLGCHKSNLLTGYSVLLMREGDFTKAKDIIVKVYADKALSGEDKFHLRINHAVCQWKLGNLDKAMEDMKLALDYGKTGLAYDVMSSLLIEKARETGDFSEAETFCKEALDYDEDDLASINHMGWLAFYQGDSKTARGYFKRVLDKNDRYCTALVGMAAIEYKSGETDAAREHAERALQYHFPTTSIVTRDYAMELKKLIG